MSPSFRVIYIIKEKLDKQEAGRAGKSQKMQMMQQHISSLVARKIKSNQEAVSVI